MPPITTVPPFSTSTSVVICFVSMAGALALPKLTTCPTLSLLIFSVMITLSSGVICGLTLSESVAFLNETDVAPLDVDCW
ncbi:hypothetical protein D3C83_17210 [compost metagenome]